MKQIIIFFIISIVLTVSPASARQQHWYSNENNTYGWSIMTPEEQKMHHVKMRHFTKYDECRQYIEQHDELMKQRAADKGIELPAIGQNPCDTMKSRRMLK